MVILGNFSVDIVADEGHYEEIMQLTGHHVWLEKNSRPFHQYQYNGKALPSRASVHGTVTRYLEIERGAFYILHFDVFRGFLYDGFSEIIFDCFLDDVKVDYGLTLDEKAYNEDDEAGVHRCATIWMGFASGDGFTRFRCKFRPYVLVRN